MLRHTALVAHPRKLVTTNIYQSPLANLEIEMWHTTKHYVFEIFSFMDSLFGECFVRSFSNAMKDKKKKRKTLNKCNQKTLILQIDGQINDWIIQLLSKFVDEVNSSDCDKTLLFSFFIFFSLMAKVRVEQRIKQTVVIII